MSTRSVEATIDDLCAFVSSIPRHGKITFSRCGTFCLWIKGLGCLAVVEGQGSSGGDVGVVVQTLKTSETDCRDGLWSKSL